MKKSRCVLHFVDLSWLLLLKKNEAKQTYVLQRDRPTQQHQLELRCNTTTTSKPQMQLGKTQHMTDHQDELELEHFI